MYLKSGDYYMNKMEKLKSELETMTRGIRMYNVDGIFHTNFNEAVNLFQSMSLNIVDLHKIKRVLNKMPISEIYHPNLEISSKKIMELTDLTNDKEMLEAFDNRKSVFRCGIINGSYKETIIEAFNSIFNNQIREKIKLVISDRMNYSMNIVECFISEGVITQGEGDKMKSDISSDYLDVISESGFEIKEELSKIKVFSKTQEVNTVNSIVQDIVLSTALFEKIYNINNKIKNIANQKNFKIKNVVNPVFAIH